MLTLLAGNYMFNNINYDRNGAPYDSFVESLLSYSSNPTLCSTALSLDSSQILKRGTKINLLK